MTESPIQAESMDRLASAVAARFAASAASVRLSSVSERPSGPPGLVDRLASAAGQRLAARRGTDIDLLASAVAHRLAASEAAAPLVESTVLHYRGAPYSPQLDAMVGDTAASLARSQK